MSFILRLFSRRKKPKEDSDQKMKDETQPNQRSVAQKKTTTHRTVKRKKKKSPEAVQIEKLSEKTDEQIHSEREGSSKYLEFIKDATSAPPSEDLEKDPQDITLPSGTVTFLDASKMIFKICLLGDGGVGKTSLRHRYLGKGFKTDYLETIGADFALKNLTIDGIEIKFQIWDLAGQDRFSIIRSSYYGGALGALLLFDVTRPASFANLPKWMAEFWDNSGTSNPVPIFIIGNKVDLRERITTSVSKVAAEGFCQALSQKTIQDYGFSVPYLETSAKTGLNVDEAFTKLARLISSWKAKKDKNDKENTNISSLWNS